MAKRFIERPTARQIMTEAERRVLREIRQNDYDAKRENADSWLAGNFAPVPKVPAMHERLSVSDLRDKAEYAQFKRFEAMDDHNETPDPLGKTGHYEPKSIYDPAPPSRIRREAPKKRKGRDPYAVSDDCELPEYRTTKTYTIEDAHGRAVGAIEVNQFSKRIRVGGSGLIDRPDRLRHLPK
jgi:hypothetical protein